MTVAPASPPGSLRSLDIDLGSITAQVGLMLIPVADDADAADVAAALCGGKLVHRWHCGAARRRQQDPDRRRQPGDKVLATNTKTGKTGAEAVTAVLVRHDIDLYDLTVRSRGRTQVIHTTANHRFWVPYHHYWVTANKLSKNERLKSSDGAIVTVVGGTTRPTMTAGCGTLPSPATTITASMYSPHSRAASTPTM